MDIKNIEKEFDKKFTYESNPIDLADDSVIEMSNIIKSDFDDGVEIKSFYRQAIRELMLECVGENWSLKGNFNGSDPNDISLLSENKGYNRRGAEIVERINKMFEEK